jgi:DNA-binding HxlR family transcriptional regulator
MERLGWVSRERWNGYADLPQFAYTLTPKGRAAVTLLLGLDTRDKEERE